LNISACSRFPQIQPNIFSSNYCRMPSRGSMNFRIPVLIQFQFFGGITQRLGPDRACNVQACWAWALHTAGLGFCRPGLAWPGGQARGLECRLSPKTRLAHARDFGLCSKSSGLGPIRPCQRQEHRNPVPRWIPKGELKNYPSILALSFTSAL
jgi:hypothetical protein